MQPLRPHGQRAPPRTTTTWPISPAAPRPSHRSPLENETAAHAGAPEDAEDGPKRPPGAELELRVGRDVDVVADTDVGPESPCQRLAERVAARPIGEVAGVRDDPGLLVGVAGRADAHARKVRRLHTRGFGGLVECADHRLSHILRAALRGRRVTRLSGDLAVGCDDRRLDLRSAEIDSPAKRLLFGHMPSLGRASAQRCAKSSPEWAMIAATIVSSTDGTSISATTSWIFGAARAAPSSMSPARVATQRGRQRVQLVGKRRAVDPRALECCGERSDLRRAGPFAKPLDRGSGRIRPTRFRPRCARARRRARLPIRSRSHRTRRPGRDPRRHRPRACRARRAAPPPSATAGDAWPARSGHRARRNPRRRARRRPRSPGAPIRPGRPAAATRAPMQAPASFAPTTARGSSRPASPARSIRSGSRILFGHVGERAGASGEPRDRAARSRAELFGEAAGELPASGEDRQHRDRRQRRAHQASIRHRRLIAAKPAI